VRDDTVAPPGGECWADLGERMQSWFDAALERYGGRAVLVEKGSVSMIDVNVGRRRIRLWNDITHLRDSLRRRLRLPDTGRCVLGRRRRSEPYTRSGATIEGVTDQSVAPDELTAWWEDFEAAARRPLAVRLRYAFIRTYKPVLDDADYRAFDTTERYRAWCEANLPSWLGYGRDV
jgi:hypothetical protein